MEQLSPNHRHSGRRGDGNKIRAEYIIGLEALISSIGSGIGDMLQSTYDPAGVSEQLVGLTATQTLSNKTLGSPVINGSVSGTAILDEDDMASDSNTKLATQQSIKAYVDNAVGSGLTGSGAANRTAFWTGTSALSYDDNFTWDNTNKRLGLGTSSPSYRLHVAVSSSATSGTLYTSATTLYLNPSSAASGVQYTTLNQVVLDNSGAHSGDVSAAQFIATKQNSASINNLYGQILRVDNASGAGGINNAWGTVSEVFNSTSSSAITSGVGFFARVANLNTNVITTGYGARFAILNNSGGTITTAYAGEFSITNSSGTITTAITNILSANPAFSANNQTRVGIQVAAVPDPGAFTGTVAQAIDILGTGGERDGVRFRQSADAILFASATDTIEVSDNFKVGGDYYSADGSQGFTGSWTNAGGDTVTVKNGIITDVS